MANRKCSLRALVIFALCSVTAFYLLSGSFDSTASPFRSPTSRKHPTHDDVDYDLLSGRVPIGDHSRRPPATNSHAVKAVFVILVRNHDLYNIRYSLRQLEDRFNKKYNYPYVFLNDDEFTEEFKELTTSTVSGKTYYGKVDGPMWNYPEWINVTKADQARADMERAKVIYGGSLSYRRMCRFQSGWFFRHPLLDQFDYYWRVEPSVQFYCDLDYDVFKFMADNKLKYGWTLSLHEYRETIPTLWETTRQYMRQYPEYVLPESDPGSLWDWVTEDKSASYNGCHFWSNFEVGASLRIVGWIGSIKFLRSEQYLSYFNYLDHVGGFFYERWGDAPVHSLAVAMFLRRSEVHFFNDIGYRHEPFMHCPTDRELITKCYCNPNDNFVARSVGTTSRATRRRTRISSTRGGLWVGWDAGRGCAGANVGSTIVEGGLMMSPPYLHMVNLTVRGL
ncbi:glycolipid 2-alpha-mannosyltransferase [Jimgerdemannia flammicorona]|uniref:Glycolipid 2-alpha-mannosyltransferase n=1 Tax=Jimgerdemannia flammicorona TaxID=994334 RepID=A0A433QVH0_9FUNG|nr:glycolipid 2-alpha-mannosyltransferase [Jimgerdemannia flammicorona]